MSDDRLDGLKTTKFTVLRLAPTFKGSETADDAARLFRECFRYIPQDTTVSLAELRKYVDDGADVAVLEVEVNGEHICRIRVVP